MGRALALTLQAAEVLATERALREQSDAQASRKCGAACMCCKNARRLMERLTRIQRSINSRAPLPDVLQTIVAGAAELIGDPYVVLRRIDADDPDFARGRVCGRYRARFAAAAIGSRLVPVRAEWPSRRTG